MTDTCMTKLPTPIYIPHCTGHCTLQCTLHSAHCAVQCTLHCTMHTTHCTLYTVHCTLHSALHCTLHTQTAHFPLQTALNNAQLSAIVVVYTCLHCTLYFPLLNIQVLFSVHARHRTLHLILLPVLLDVCSYFCILSFQVDK